MNSTGYIKFSLSGHKLLEIMNVFRTCLHCTTSENSSLYKYDVTGEVGSNGSLCCV